MDVTIKNSDLLVNPVLLKARAWLVHIYTSLGLIVAFFSLIAIFNEDIKGFFILQSIAMFIDSTDGFMARAFKVKIWTPEMDGRKLDDITDFINYTFMPVFFAYHFGMVNENNLIILGIVLITSGYGFCHTCAKTQDGYFTGFPNFWNILIFYLFVFNVDPIANAIILMVFAALIFVPFKYLSYSSKSFRTLLLISSLVFAIPVALFILNFELADMRLIYISLLGPVFYLTTAVFTFFNNPIAK
ncbi:MAG: phosphatidylcholine/phosphatidylserine synthase [Anaerolineaceae bacterium]